MLNFTKKLGIMLAVVLLVFGLLPYHVAHAVITSCEADFDSNQINTGTTADFNLTLQDTNVTPIQWVHIASPSPDLTIQNITANGWNVNMTSTDATLTGNSIDPGASLQATITLSADNNAGNARWSIQATDDPGGNNAITCTGSQSLTIVTAPPTISNINLTNLTSKAVTINWDTDIASDSMVNYGSDQSYGQTNSSALQTTSHSLTLNGLTPNTGYHFQISSTNDNGTGISADSTFLTAIEQAPVTMVVTIPGKTTTVISPVEIQVTNPSDKTPPTIAVSSKIPNIVQSMPTIYGVANDDVAVVRVEYSTDGGLNWQPMDSAPLLGGKKVNFNFTPLNLDDGNYVVIARAIDPGGNITMTSSVKVVVDRLPPTVGGDIISFGSQVLQPDGQGELTTLAGVDLKVTLSAIGGATNVNLSSQTPEHTTKSSSFNLTRSADTGLWNGLLSFPKAGTYTLVAHASDGAGNRTTRTINFINVSGSARVVTSGQSHPATVTVYYWVPDLGNWVVWDAAAYGETNPQTTSKQGDIKLLLPPGKYYLKTTAKGFQVLTSQIFTLNQPTPVTTDLHMKKGGWQTYLPWLNFSKQFISLNSNQVATKPSLAMSQNNMTNKILPSFTLNDSATGAQHNATEWLGKPTVLSVMSSWAPSTSEQVGALGQLQSNGDINIVPIALQENADKLRAYNDIAGYDLRWFADPDSILTAALGTNNIPTHYFIDRTGVIRKVTYGVLTKEQLLNNLTDL